MDILLPGIVPTVRFRLTLAQIQDILLSKISSSRVSLLGINCRHIHELAITRQKLILGPLSL